MTTRMIARLRMKEAFGKKYLSTPGGILMAKAFQRAVERGCLVMAENTFTPKNGYPIKILSYYSGHDPEPAWIDDCDGDIRLSANFDPELKEMLCVERSDLR